MSTPAAVNDGNETARRVWRVEGQVQGVGFRPFVYRLADEMAVSGSVMLC